MCVSSHLPPLSCPSSAVVICIIVLLKKYRFLPSVSVHCHSCELPPSALLNLALSLQRLVLYLSIASFLSSIIYMLVRRLQSNTVLLLG